MPLISGVFKIITLQETQKSAIAKIMKRIIRIILPILMLTTTVRGDHSECLEAAVDEMNELHRTGHGCEDGIFNAVSSSMLGWGVGLFVGIALLTGLIHNSHQESKSTTSTNSSK